jgi:RNA binding exosome subunit
MIDQSMDIDALLNKYRKVIDRKTGSTKKNTTRNVRDDDKELYLRTKQQIENGTFKFRDSDQSYISNMENSTI